MDGERKGGHDDGGDGGGEGAKYRGNDDRSVARKHGGLENLAI